MKKLLLFMGIFIFTSICWGQLLVEDFDYGSTSTDLVTASSSLWITNTGGTGSLDVQYISSGLSYSGYTSSGIGGAVSLSNSRTGDDYTTFSLTNSGSIYCSALISVSSVTTTAAGEYVFHLGSTSTHYCRLYLRNESGNLRFGISKSTEGATFSAVNYQFNTTYLIVMKYTFNSGAQDDNVDLWVFSSGVPSTEANAGVATISNIVAATTDASSISSISLREGTTAHSVIIDGIRVATSWSQSPLPVELTSFTASKLENSVKLNWNTATEVNNYGFEVYRSIENNEWTNIGFVRGNGNSNSPKNYTFIDETVPAGIVKYKLKQIDFDGSFEYSKIVEVNIDTPNKLVLYQNSPNPFNPSTVIKFALPAASNVEINVYNILGEKVKTLINEFRAAGEHKINFNAGDLSSGIYLYSLTTGNFTEHKKMLLIK